MRSRPLSWSVRLLCWIAIGGDLSLATPTSANASSSLVYDYIVVGSGAGGGPLASRLAIAGHSVLLIESGNDQGASPLYTVPGLQAGVSEDPEMRWDMYVNHYQDQKRAQRDPKYVYDIGNGEKYVGLDPPAGAKPLGIWYPRAGTLGGCVSHNALIWITPHASDWNGIAHTTGDASWAAENIEQYLDRVYEWLPTMPADSTILAQDPMLSQHLLGGAEVVGEGSSPLDGVTGLQHILDSKDPNARDPGRDSLEGFFPVPLIAKNGARFAVRERITQTVADGHPLTVRTNCFVTKVIFDRSGHIPVAKGVQFLDGNHLYRASPLSGAAGTPGTATARKEVILAGGTYNTVQLLKLSGIGPRAELKRFGIETVVNLPGVGLNMQDRYEIPLIVKHPDDFGILKGCTFDLTDNDECWKQWRDHPVQVHSSRGPLASNGLRATLAIHSDTAPSSDIDLYIFAAPFNFTGYFPGWAEAAAADHKHFAWYTLKAHTRNTAGTVTLKSADPLDTPLINFNYFDTGTTKGGADKTDLAAIVQGIRIGRQALKNYNDYASLGGSSFVEESPGTNITSDEALGQYVKDHAWGHHACCTNKIGSDGDLNAVLDSKFRVRGTKGLRVVDASVFPKIPGIFIQAPIMIASEKAADDILKGY